MTLKETILWITIALAVNGTMLLMFTYAGFRLINWGMDYIGLPRQDPPPPQPPAPQKETRQASEDADGYDREVVFLSEEEARYFLNLDNYKPFGELN